MLIGVGSKPAANRDSSEDDVEDDESDDDEDSDDDDSPTASADFSRSEM